MSIGTQEILTPEFNGVLPPTELPYEDGVPLESDWHFCEIALLKEVVNLRLAQRDDYYVGGNMFLYVNLAQVRNQDFRGPDFFFVKGVRREPLRKYWAVWDEGGRYPNLIVELLSPTTASVDRGVKKTLYESVFRTPEYILVEPEKKTLEGFRLNSLLVYEPIPFNDQGRIWSVELGAFLGFWEGVYEGHRASWLRLFDDKGKLCPTKEEEIARLQAIVSGQNTGQPGEV